MPRRICPRRARLKVQDSRASPQGGAGESDKSSLPVVVAELETNKEDEIESLKSVVAKQERGPDGKYICYVCGEKAGKHSYYGGQVCASCRAFFR